MNLSNEIKQRQDRAREMMKTNGYEALVLATGENIQYLTGVTEPSVHTCGVAIIPQQDTSVLAVMWLDKEPAEEQSEEVSVETYTPYNFGAIVAKTLSQSGIAKGTIAMDDRAMTVLSNSIKRTLPDANVIKTSSKIEELRWIKSKDEVNMIKRSCEIADQGMQAAIDAVKPGMTELQVASMAEHQMMMLGSDRLKHRTIVASGHRNSLIHPFATKKKIADSELVAIDLGAVYQGYCSDIARTTFVGNPSKDLQNDFGTLRNAQKAALEKIRPGAIIKEIEAAAYEVAKNAESRLIGHVGHSIGLKVEEDPHLWSARLSYPETIEKNMVLVFFQTTLQSKHSLGIRLEDTVLVTDSGAEMLTTHPRNLSS
jgi:Xaa-Pro aminopeptidase